MELIKKKSRAEWTCFCKQLFDYPLNLGVYLFLWKSPPQDLHQHDSHEGYQEIVTKSQFTLRKEAAPRNSCQEMQTSHRPTV